MSLLYIHVILHHEPSDKMERKHVASAAYINRHPPFCNSKKTDHVTH
jgi:hypothetical protein